MTGEESIVRDTIESAIRRYLDVLGGKQGESLYDLAKALDGLVLAYHQTQDVDPDVASECASPPVDERQIIDVAAAAFPDLDWYALVDPQDGPEPRAHLSSAVCDLAEIASDLLRVLWLFGNASHNDAVWDFRFGYQIHWGRHLHEVRKYLHDLAAW